MAYLNAEWWKNLKTSHRDRRARQPRRTARGMYGEAPADVDFGYIETPFSLADFEDIMQFDVL